MTALTLKKKAEEWRPVFLEALSSTCNVSKACDTAGISRQTAYRHRNTYPKFAAEWDEALETGIGALEDEAVRRAHEGVDEPVFYQGEEVATVKKYSDTLLIFLLKAHRPEKYRERYSHEITGKGGGPIKHSFEGLEDLSDEELDDVIASENGKDHSRPKSRAE